MPHEPETDVPATIPFRRHDREPDYLLHVCNPGIFRLYLSREPGGEIGLSVEDDAGPIRIADAAPASACVRSGPGDSRG